jgi:hypothetical protein
VNLLTQAHLKELLEYDTAPGIFKWKVNRGGANKGDISGSIKRHGHLAINVDGHSYQAHRLAWLYVYGQFHF